MALNDEIILVSSPNRNKPLSNTSYTSKSIETFLKNKAVSDELTKISCTADYEHRKTRTRS